MSTSEVLQRVTDALDRNDVAYMLTGSFASAYYRSITFNIDCAFRQSRCIQIGVVLVRREVLNEATQLCRGCFDNDVDVLG